MKRFLVGLLLIISEFGVLISFTSCSDTIIKDSCSFDFECDWEVY